MKKKSSIMKKKINFKKFLFYILFVIIGYAVGHHFSPAKEETVAMAPANIEQNQAVSDDFSPEALLAYMKKLKIKYPETVLSQARLETGNFQSEIFKENHNLFGMKVAASRPTSAIGTNRGHAQYRNWKESVVDYALFQSFIIAKLPSNNIKEYRSYIQKFYSTTSDYLARIDKTIKDADIFAPVTPAKASVQSETKTASIEFGIMKSFKALYTLPDVLGGNSAQAFAALR